MQNDIVPTLRGASRARWTSVGGYDGMYSTNVASKSLIHSKDRGEGCSTARWKRRCSECSRRSRTQGRSATGRQVVRTGPEVDQTTAYTVGGRLTRYGKTSERAAGTNKLTNRSQHNSKQVFETFAIYGRPRGCTSEPPRGGCLVVIANCHRWRKAIAARPRSNREAIGGRMEAIMRGLFRSLRRHPRPSESTAPASERISSLRNTPLVVESHLLLATSHTSLYPYNPRSPWLPSAHKPRTRIRSSVSRKLSTRTESWSSEYVCMICGPGARGLTGVVAIQYQCALCYGSVSRKSDFPRHMRQHTREEYVVHCVLSWCGG